MFEHIQSFNWKLHLFQSQLEKGNIVHFCTFKNVMESLQVSWHLQVFIDVLKRKWFWRTSSCLSQNMIPRTKYEIINLTLFWRNVYITNMLLTNTWFYWLQTDIFISYWLLTKRPSSFARKQLICEVWDKNVTKIKRFSF